MDGAALVRMAASCALVCALAWGMGWWLRRKQPWTSSRSLCLLETLPLGQGRALFLVACEGRRLLLGATSQHLQVLAELSPSEGEGERPLPLRQAGWVPFLLLGLAWASPSQAQTPSASLSLGPEALHTLLVLTLLALLPFLLAVMTCFTRIIIVLSLLRVAMGTPQTPPNSVLMGLALFMTLFLMAPTLQEAHRQGLQPLLRGEKEVEEAVVAGYRPFHRFMVRQAREKDIALFLRIAQRPNPRTPEEVPATVLIPAFILSEVRTGFEIGFLISLPFLLVDLVVASVMMGLGMLMVPPMLVSLPLKLLLFVLADGWHLLLQGLALGVR